MRLVKILQGGHFVPEDKGSLFARGTGSIPPEFILEVENIEGNIVRFKSPLPEWFRPGCKLAVSD